jgi:hypothetical protein
MRAWSIVFVACAACAGDDGGGPPVDPTDVDGDGIANDADLCPNRRDPVQHDDDADGVGDVCDNCPATPNADQRDLTEVEATLQQFPDGVGDACDRRPTLADDTLARFFPFADPVEANAFTGSGWTIANDRASGTNARWFSKRNEMGDGITLQAKISKIAWTGTDGTVTVAVDGDGVNGGFACSIVHGPGADQLVLTEIGGGTTSTPVSPFASNARVILTVSRAYSQLPTGKAACFLSVDGSSEKRIDLVTADDNPFGTYALVTAMAEVDVEAATVMTTPFACDTPFTGGPLACP